MELNFPELALLTSFRDDPNSKISDDLIIDCILSIISLVFPVFFLEISAPFSDKFKLTLEPFEKRNSSEFLLNRFLHFEHTKSEFVVQVGFLMLFEDEFRKLSESFCKFETKFLAESENLVSQIGRQ